MNIIEEAMLGYVASAVLTDNIFDSTVLMLTSGFMRLYKTLKVNQGVI